MRTSMAGITPDWTRFFCLALLTIQTSGCLRHGSVESTPALMSFCEEGSHGAWVDSLAPTHLAETIERVRKELSDASGLSLVLFGPTDIFFEYHTGPAHLNSHRRVDSETAFYIASSTKSLIATTTLMLVEEGVLDLDTPIGQYVPTLHFQSWFLSEDEITLRHLLTHDTGITSKALELRTSMTGEWDRDTLLRLYGAASRGLAKPQYSNLNYILIGIVLEQVTEDSWQNLLQQHLFNPLDMRRSFTSWKEPSENIAYPHMLGTDWSLLSVPKEHNVLKDNTLFLPEVASRPRVTWPDTFNCF